ncbi:MAG: ATPase, T2SS/T4P/T4SS family [Desulfobulbaceae bacterium]|nr:ATPase, T2SS/T4P/T4SS family [Desulfobulbaceae bacterium]
MKQPPTKPNRPYGEIVNLLLSKKLLTKKQVDHSHRIRDKLKTSQNILEILKELKYITDEQIHQTIRDNILSLRIGDMLVELGLINEQDLLTALHIQSQSKPKRKLGEVLVDSKLLEEKKLLNTLSLQLGYEYTDVEFAKIDENIFRKIPLRHYESRSFIPLRIQDNKAVVCFADPLDNNAIRTVSNAMNMTVIPAISSRKSIITAIERLLPTDKTNKTTPNDDNAVTIVNNIITEAIELQDVSDIHIEPLSDRVRIRFRTDGVLVSYKNFPINIHASLSSRIKVLCKADIAEKRRHQDGRMLFVHKESEMDLRVSFYVTVFGEKIVLRLLNRQSELLNIDELGMPRLIRKKFINDALDRPSGVILITGPTGSGKTTTVYSCINYLNNSETSIITAEDPVEYVIEGIGQCSIDPKINLTFEETLRHIVRQDPDVVVIGEIRDRFSAEVAVQAAMTGHKILTTFHTEDSIGGLLRLLNMNIDAFLISSTVVCIVAQRLLRKICPQCAMPYTLTPKDFLRLGMKPEHLENAHFSKGTGCEFCRYTGYKGRIPVFEVLVLNEDVRDGLIQRRTSHQIRKISIESTNMVTLFEDGIYKAAAGITTIDEIMRCLPRFSKPRKLEEIKRLAGE